MMCCDDAPSLIKKSFNASAVCRAARRRPLLLQTSAANFALSLFALYKRSPIAFLIPGCWFSHFTIVYHRCAY